MAPSTQSNLQAPASSLLQPNGGVKDALADRAVRARARWHGTLKENRMASEAVAAALLLRSRMPAGGDDARITALLRAFSRVRSTGLLRRLEAALHAELSRPALRQWQARPERFARYRDAVEDPRLTSSLLIKAPQPNGEKGILYVSFEYNWMRLLAHADVRRLLSEYVLVGASSWSPTDFSVFASFAGLSEDPLFIGISNAADMATYSAFRPIIEPLPILASDWVDPSLYTPKPLASRQIDILMVANFMRFKRHWLLFDALRRMPAHLKVMLIGIAGPGRRERDLREEARAFGVRQELEFGVDIPIETVADHQCNAKIAVILSRREGSCVSVAESLFADTPVAMSERAHIGSRAYINDATGMLIDERHAARDLMTLLERRHTYKPREWAMAHIQASETSARLNDALRSYMRERGRPWTTDITPMCWRHDPEYLDLADEARMQGAVDRLQRDYGIVFRKYDHHHVKSARPDTTK